MWEQAELSPLLIKPDFNHFKKLVVSAKVDIHIFYPMTSNSNPMYISNRKGYIKNIYKAVSRQHYL